MATVNELVIKIILDNKNAITKVEEFGERVDKTTQKSKSRLKTLTESFKKNWIAITAATSGVILGLNKVINAASDFQEANSKFNVVFQGMTQQAIAWRKELVKNFAMSQREASQFLSSIQDLLVPMGVAKEKAGELSFEVVKLAADLGSFNNLSTEQVIMDIQSALVGNFETMKKYGVVLNETTIKQKAMNEGVWDGKGVLDAATKAELAYKLIVEGSQAAIGDMARTADSYANIKKKVAARTEDAALKLGKIFMPAAASVLGIIVKLLEWFIKLDDGTRTFILVVGALTAAGWKLVPMFNAWNTSITVLGVSIKTILGYVGLIVTAATLLYTAWKTNFLGIRDIFQKLKSFADKFLKPIGMAVKKLMNFFNELPKPITLAVGALLVFISVAQRGVPKIMMMSNAINFLGISLKSLLGWFGLIMVTLQLINSAIKTNLFGIRDAIEKIGIGKLVIGFGALIAIGWKVIPMLSTLRIAIARLLASIGPGGWLLIGLGALASAFFLLSGHTKDAKKELSDFREEVKTFNLEQAEMELFRLDLRIREISENLKSAKPDFMDYVTAILTGSSLSTIAFDAQTEKLNELGKELELLRKKKEILSKTIKKLNEERDKETDETNKEINAIDKLGSRIIDLEKKISKQLEETQKKWRELYAERFKNISDITDYHNEKIQQEARAAKESAEEQGRTYETLWQMEIERSRWFFNSLSAGYDEFFNTILDMEMSGKERREQIWESMKQSFAMTIKDMLKNFIITKTKESFIHTLVEKTKTKVTKTQTAARSNVSITALLKEGWQILKSIGIYIGQIAVKLFSWFASKGPIGVAIGFAAIPALIAGIRSAIRGLMKFEKGGIAKKEVLALVGEAGDSEAVIPLNQRGAEFMAKVMPKIILTPQINASSAPIGELKNMISDLKETIKNLKLDVSIDSSELAIIVENGNKVLEKISY